MKNILLLIIVSLFVVNAAKNKKHITPLTQQLREAKGEQMKQEVLNRIEEMKDMETFNRNEMLRLEQQEAKKMEMEMRKRERKEAKKLSTKRHGHQPKKAKIESDDLSEHTRRRGGEQDDKPEVTEEPPYKKDKPFIRYSIEKLMDIREANKQDYPEGK